MPLHRSYPTQPKGPTVLLASAYRGKADFVEEVHRYDGCWAEAMTYNGSRYHGYIQEGSAKDERLRFATDLSADSVGVLVSDIDAVDIRSTPHRWVVPWELEPER